MKSKPNYSELVHQYLANELSNEQLDAFEAELRKNDALKKELIFQKKLDSFIQDDELERFKKVLDLVYYRIKTNKNNIKFFTIGKLSLIAASIIILISLSIVFFNSHNGGYNSNEIFNQYYEGYPSSYTTRAGEVCLKDSQFMIALEHYKMNKYEEAKISFMTVCENHPDNIASKFYLGIIGIELGDFNGALGYFDQVIKSKDQFYTEQSEWHRALCLIKLELKHEATKQLNTIIEQKGFYVDKAAEIISMLE